MHLPFGIEAASLISPSADETLIFGGRLDNGDTDSIWSMNFMENENVEFAFSQKGQLSEKKNSFKIVKPKSQDFYVCLGGKKDVVSCYACGSL